MANTLRIKRRAAGGAAGAPASLANAELAFNEQDNTLYYGTGTGGAGGTATSVIAIGGPGAFVGLSGDQTVAGIKTFSSTIAGSISGNAGTATALATARSLGLSGDVTGTASFNGTANASIAATLANSGVTAGSYGSATQVGQVTVDAKGRVTAASNVAITFPVTSVAGRTGAIALSTSDVSEGTNLYFTDARVRTNRLDQLAAPTAAVDFNSQRITGLADPTGAQDAATKNYVDLTVQGLDPKASVKAASTANIASLSGTMTIDGVALVAGDRVLVKDQTTALANGVYVVASGAWARAVDLSTWDEHVAAYLFVEQGTVNADIGYLCTADASGTLGTTAITFVQFNGAGQIVAAGSKEAITKLVATPPDKARVIELKVAGAFHTHFMQPAVAKLAEAAARVVTNAPALKLWSNVDGQLVHSGSEFLSSLVSQVSNPVRWDLCMSNIDALSATVVELPPAGALAGLAKRGMPNSTPIALKTAADLEKIGAL